MDNVTHLKMKKSDIQERIDTFMKNLNQMFIDKEFSCISNSLGHIRYLTNMLKVVDIKLSQKC
ncbi:hypothetical protein A3Q56_06281 [Intoshia linei]|uniref:Uncharacterized protein n=1 Tax=Intoshia linei TaxID=1819745 RepID=A0A177AVI5_9BILA|nr:hypothetical protein A3Q56_06281 [Intoshia linei]